jgi:hypothetical protein
MLEDYHRPWNLVRSSGGEKGSTTTVDNCPEGLESKKYEFKKSPKREV